MEPEIRNFAQLERFIKERPKEADALASQWQEFAKQNPEVLSFQTAEEFYAWRAQHPEKHVDENVWAGKEIQDVYFYLREQHEDWQIQTQGRVSPSVIPANLPYLPLLAAAFLSKDNNPKIMEDDRDYQKIAHDLKKLWLEENPGKDFRSREGLDYLHGSLEDDNAPTLKKDAEKIFRANPRYRKRIERYDREKKKVYKNPDQDPVAKHLKKTVEEHTRARQKHLGAPETIVQTIEKQSLQRFIDEYPEKARAYTKKSDKLLRLKRKSEEEEKREKEKRKGIFERIQDVRSFIENRAQDIERYRLYKAPRIIARIGRVGGRLVAQAGRTTISAGSKLVGVVGRVAARMAIQVTTKVAMMAGRGLVAGAASPVGWIVIAVIIVIIVIVFLIIMFLDVGGGGQPKGTNLVDCVDSTGASISVVDGNTCAVNLAAYFSNLTSTPITATCVDKCLGFGPVICDRNPNNACESPNASCGIDETFCIQYSPPPSPGATWFYDCSSPNPYYIPRTRCDNSGIIPPTPTFKRVFVTSTIHNGNLLAQGRAITPAVTSGLEGAGSICQSLADTAGLGGTWKAWLSSSTQNAIGSIPDSEYRLVDGTTVIAYSKTGLVDGTPIANPINMDENGALSGDFVWTSTKSDGTVKSVVSTCDDWEDGSSGKNGFLGNTTSTLEWTDENFGSACNISRRLYCFEQ